MKKTAFIYGAAILFYIPVNIYNGYFKMEPLLPNLIKDILFDGTLYHLWYLPASMMGATIAWYLVRRPDYPRALAVSFFLYLIGLFGDSYYGIAEKLPYINSFYKLLFQVFDYTRNGLFFAPVFFVLGGLIADNRHKIVRKGCIFRFAVCFVLLLAEALTLYHSKLQRHDSMYLFLLPCMYFLFHILLHFKVKRFVFLRTTTLLLYIVHPMMIVLLRLFAKLLHLQSLLVDNSILHYFMVCLISAVFSVTATLLWSKYKPKKEKHDISTDRAYIEINSHHLMHNIKVLRKAMPPKCQLMAVVKTQAYGHGAYEISTYLDKAGIRSFAVATIDEGIRLRKYGIRGEILILSYTNVLRAPELKKYDLMQTITDFEYAKALNRQGISVKAHMKIDTGMHRLGMPYNASIDAKNIFAMKNIKVCGIFTHLCCADSRLPEDIAFTREQIDRFYHLIEELKESGIPIPKLHIQSSYGLLNYPDLKCDYVRTGVAMYGVQSFPNDNTVLSLDLRPVLSLKSRVILIRQIKKGDSVGYGRTFTAKRDSRIAILPIGYGDGFPRSLSGKSFVLIRGQRVPIIGRVCMDSLAVDVTDIEDISVGDTATLLGKDTAEELTAPHIADSLDSISNELLCRLSTRLPVVVKNSE